MTEPSPSDAVVHSKADLTTNPVPVDPAGMITPLPETRPTPAAPAVSVTAVPGYAVLGELGRGGMGVVYHAWQASLNRPVALKMILAGAHAGTDVLARFKSEAEALAQLQHPNIVQVYDTGEHGGQPYFALEFVDGGSLAHKLRAGPLLPRPAAALVETLARAMAAAHRKGIIHRDLKPANVLLTQDGTPKVTDFGLAKNLAIDVAQTVTGQVMGTPSYMAPEQAEGRVKDIGPATDVYALGAILYELLTGRAPFRAATPLDTIKQVVEDEPVPPRRLQPQTPRDLETICLKCLCKGPGRRYDSALELADDLRRWCEGQPITARPTPGWERAAKWARRRPAAAALTVMCLLVALGVSVGGFVLADLQRERAEEQAQKTTIEKALRGLAEANASEAFRQKKVAEDARADSLRETIRANDAFIRSRKVVNDLRVLVVQNPLFHEPRFALVRRDLLLRISTNYEQILKDQFTAKLTRLGPGDRQRTAGIRHMLADLQEMLGEDQAAEQHYRAALELYDGLVKDFPDRADLQLSQAGVLNDLAILLQKTKRPKDAAAALQTALQIKQRLVTLYPQQRSYRRDLGNAHLNQGNLHLEAKRFSAAGAEYRQALATFDQLVAEDAKETEYRHRQALAHSYLGTCMTAQGKTGEAATEYQLAVELWEALLAKDAKSEEYRIGLGRATANRALLLHLAGRGEEAKGFYNRAVAALQQLVEDIPASQDYRQTLAETLKNLAVFHAGAKRHLDSEQVCRQAIIVYQKLTRDFPANTAYRTNLAAMHNQLGLALVNTARNDEADEAWHKAAEVQEALVQQEPGDAGHWKKLIDYRTSPITLWAKAGDTRRLEETAAELVAAQERRAAAFPAAPELKDDLGTTLTSLADLYLKADEPAKARPPLEKAVKNLRAAAAAKPGQAKYLADLSSALLFTLDAAVRLRDHEPAFAAAEVLARTAPANWTFLPKAAGLLAVGVAATEKDKDLPADRRAEVSRIYGDRAVALLQKAAEQGFQDADKLESGDEFKPLRPRPDFQELVRRMKSPDKPGKSPPGHQP